MNENVAKPKSDVKIALGWAKWPAILGGLIGANLSRDVFEKVTRPHSLADEYIFGAFSVAYSALLAGGFVFCVAFVILKAIKTLKQQK